MARRPLRSGAVVVVVYFTCLALLLVEPVVTQLHHQQSMAIRVTAVEDAEQVMDLEINFTILAVDGQFYVNEIPVSLSGVSRLNCSAFLSKNGNNSKADTMSQAATVRVRILLRLWPLETDSQLNLLVFNEEVIEVEGVQVQQSDMYEINILMSKEFKKLRQSTYSFPMKESMVHSIPPESDYLYTVPNLSPEVDNQAPLQTTSHYPIKQAETTVEEQAAAGKLPETPLGMYPDIYFDKENMEADMLPGDQLPETPLRSEPTSSYKAICQWMEHMREKLHRFLAESLPLFFSVMWVVVVGVVGSSVVLKLLEMVCPSCEHKGILKLDPVTLTPVEEILEERPLLQNEQEDEIKGDGNP
ncbi:glycoprotein integral membrane protein 1 [Polypterus senegalus]|uniref:glycoprotein integral membrane protein 1 n=1 Tax=Polypterus senegalus TaxID=55291 RepID=UPI0019668547|nr:glycoprotein integral membrane protein 1 [Polypterus senegalus]